MANGLAQALEDCRTIRRRFQGGAHFLQWPIPAHNDDPEVEKEDHPMCTKSLELNCDAVYPSSCGSTRVSSSMLTIWRLRSLTPWHFLFGTVLYLHAGIEKHILQYTSCCDTMALLMLSKSLVKTCSGCLGAQTLWPLQIWWAPQRCISWRMGFTAAVHFCIPTAEWCHEEGASSTGPPLVKVNDYFHRFHRLKSSHYKIEQRQFKM